jgi:hypothetical protein
MASATTAFGPIHKNNVGAVQKLVSSVLPVTYSQHFYDTLIATPEAFTHACEKSWLWQKLCLQMTQGAATATG